ncbi:MAG: hypothetical protein OXH15_00350 [Gammaproteobacteria bacterium]|nr:hypothetical protein [Gammaproteobacteria bacterium]
MVMPDPLEGFSPGLYVAALAEVAHSDGLHAAELAILEEHAGRFGVDLDRLPALPSDLSDLPAATRVLVYRDAYMLAMADGEVSGLEGRRLEELAERLALTPANTESIRKWVHDYSALLGRFEELLRAVD